MLIPKKYVKLRSKLHKFYYIFYIVSGWYIRARSKDGKERNVGCSVISINYVGCILCTMVVHRMHPTWICYVSFGQLMFYGNQEQKV